jgi:drug/metabolite transporter (DMT)-like permease
VKDVLHHVVRWPLLLGAVLCLGGGLLIAEASGYAALVVGVLLALGALMLGAWLWALATHTNPEPRDPPLGDEMPDDPPAPK